MPQEIQLSAEDFINEIWVAPKWNIFQNPREGYFKLFVYYPFATYIYLSPGIQDMPMEESKEFYIQLVNVTNEPSVYEAKIR